MNSNGAGLFGEAYKKVERIERNIHKKFNSKIKKEKEEEEGRLI